MKKLFHLLTCYVPRRIPSSPEEFEHMKSVMINFYGLADEPQNWATVAGHLTSVPANRLRVPWGSVANAAKRLVSNHVAQQYRLAAVEALKEKLKAEFQAEADRVQKEQQPSDEGNRALEPQADGVEDASTHPNRTEEPSSSSATP